MSKTVTNMERIIAKIDNDFNPDNSDWIPRVPAWAIDAMSIIKVMQEVTNTKKYKVNERIAYDKCGFGDNIVKVLDENGCEVVEAGSKKCGCGSNSSDFFTGQGDGTDTSETSNTSDISETINNSQLINLSNTMAEDQSIRQGMDVSVVVETTITGNPITHKVTPIKYGVGINRQRNYVKVGKDKLELNFDTSCITVESKGIKTEYSETFGCEVPVVPDNGLLIECIVAWCMYKMLCRGYKHPIFNLKDNSPATNPFVFWNLNKYRAKDSVDADEQDDINSKLWRSAFYIDTFDPRR